MVSPIIRDILLPLAVFPGFIVLASRFLFGHLYEAGLGLKLADVCNPEQSVATFRLSYTGIRGLDSRVLCTLVSFFHAAMASPEASAFLAYFAGIGAPLIVIPAVEGWRNGRSAFIGYPIIFGILCQTVTVGVAMPLYWLTLILSGGAKRRPGNGSGAPTVSQAHAEATVFGVILGAVIPSVAMVILKDAYVTAIWQAFPVYVTVAQYAHLAFRPASKLSQSGYPTVRALYIGAFIVSSSIHFSTIWPILGDLNIIKHVLVPSLNVPHISAAMDFGVHHFLKWDLALGFMSSILGSLWFANNSTQFSAIVAWSAIATPLLGPGAVLMATVLWRESRLQKQPKKGKKA